MQLSKEELVQIIKDTKEGIKYVSPKLSISCSYYHIFSKFCSVANAQENRNQDDVAMQEGSSNADEFDFDNYDQSTNW